MKDYHQLRLFTTLAGTLHFGRTARACHVSPSALSRTIQRLEADVGAPLFLRDHHRVALTPAGEITLIALNTRLAPFDNPNVRRAVSAAFDRDAVRDAMGGAVVGEVPTHWIPPGVPGYAEAGGRAGPGVDFLAFPRGNLRRQFKLAHQRVLGRLHARIHFDS